MDNIIEKVQTLDADDVLLSVRFSRNLRDSVNVNAAKLGVSFFDFVRESSRSRIIYEDILDVLISDKVALNKIICGLVEASKNGQLAAQAQSEIDCFLERFFRVSENQWLKTSIGDRRFVIHLLKTGFVIRVLGQELSDDLKYAFRAAMNLL